jgi:hypothetical protein
MSVAEMTGRERVMAALRHEPVDRLPWVPLFDHYVMAGFGDDVPQDMIEAMHFLDCDILARHVPVFRNDRDRREGRWEQHEGKQRFLLGTWRYAGGVQVRRSWDDGQFVETTETPLGSIQTVRRQMETAPGSPYLAKLPVQSHDDLQVYRYAMERIELPTERDYDAFLKTDRAIGDAGIATASGPGSPFLGLVQSVFGVQYFYYALADHPQEMEELMEMLHQRSLAYYEELVQSPAEVIITYENTSTTLHSPRLYDQYAGPCLNAYAGIVHAAGKTMLVHMCGKLWGMREALSSAHYDGMADVAPPPTGDLWLDDAKRAWPDKVVVGGVDPTIFVSTDEGRVRETVSSLIERIKPYTGIMLGSADATPHGARVANLHLIRDLVDTIGRYE